MEKIPSLRSKVFTQLGTLTSQWNEQKGQEGIIAGQNTRVQLAKKRKEREQAQKRNLDKLIEDTAEVSALQAINLDQLLRKKWTDEKDAYVIMTKIKTDKEMRRLNDLCFNRYIWDRNKMKGFANADWSDTHIIHSICMQRFAFALFITNDYSIFFTL